MSIAPIGIFRFLLAKTFLIPIRHLHFGIQMALEPMSIWSNSRTCY